MKKTLITTGMAALLASGCAPSPQPGNAEKGTEPAGKLSKCASARACEDLGIRYITGDRVRIDGNKAVAYLTRACNAGRASACNSAAFIYADAEGGVKQSYTQALRYWKRGCSLGDQPSCANVELAYDKLRRAGY